MRGGKSDRRVPTEGASNTNTNTITKYARLWIVECVRESYKGTMCYLRAKKKKKGQKDKRERERGVLIK